MNDNIITASETVDTAPKPSWTLVDGSVSPERWDLGNVSTGQNSEQKTFLLWNNKGGSTDVSDMQDVLITTTDNAGDTLDVVKDRWFKVRCNSVNESTFYEIGGANTHNVSATNQDTGIIKGTANDGTVTATENFASLTFYVTPPMNVQPGIRPTFIRAIYYYT